MRIKYFHPNLSNTQNTWKGIKLIVTIKRYLFYIPKSLLANDASHTNQVEISKIKVNVYRPHKHFSDILKERSQNSIFLSPTSKLKCKYYLHSIRIYLLDLTAYLQGY